MTLPCCAGCNAALAARFEVPARPIIQRLLDHSNSKLDAAEAKLAGYWFLKTWLLLAHPERKLSFFGFTLPSWPPGRGALYSWLANGREAPEGLSLWIFKRGPLGDPTNESERLAIELPTIVVDTEVNKFSSFRFSLMAFDVSLVYHPGWRIEHPFEASGAVVRLWPAPDHPVDFGQLQAVDPSRFNWAEGPTITFTRGSYDTFVPPVLASNTDLCAQSIDWPVVSVHSPRLIRGGL